MPRELTDFLILAGGLGLLLVGGQLLVNGAVALATRFRFSTLVIGLTIVAWGTSAPELFLNLTAALDGRAQLSFGNLVGANIANLSLILGVGAMIRPLNVQTTIVRTELPVTLLFLVLMAAAGLVAYPSGGPTSARAVGILLVLCFVSYGVYAVRQGLKERRADRELQAAVRETTEEVRFLPLSPAILMLIGGAVLLKLGGDYAVDEASRLAVRLRVPADVIGLTIVAFGTTLPELVTMITAQRRDHGDLAVGNALGSCLFNAGAIFGSVLVISPFPLPDGGMVSLAVMVSVGIITIPVTLSHGGRIVRREGIALFGVYIGFTLYQIWRATSG